MSTQSSLNLSAEKSGPVECLGQTFASDNARREHYLKLLSVKLKDPEFRKIEGFPIGEDEDILALSDPPYYTACPNPWIGDFIQHYGRPYNPKEKYHREPFAADVSEGKNEPLYNLPSYYTKVPPVAIQRYLEHYTVDGDVILDAFSGSGMTGVATRTLSAKDKKRRLVILVDLSPLASFISQCMNSDYEGQFPSSLINEALAWISSNLSPLYKTSSGREFEYAIWSEWHICSECAEAIKLIDHVIDKKNLRMLDSFNCPNCGALVKTRDGRRYRTKDFDPWIEKNTDLAKTTLELLSFKVGNRAMRENPSKADIDQAAGLARHPVVLKPNELPYTHMTHERNNLPAAWGITHLNHFYTRRNYLALDRISSIKDRRLRSMLLFAAFTFFENSGTRRNRFYIDKRRPHGSPIGPLSNTLYIPGLQVECNYASKLRSAIKQIEGVRPKWPKGRGVISNQSATALKSIADASVDFIFTDPPFGGNINYSDQSQLAEWWLRVHTASACEAITNPAQKKGLSEYELLMTKAFTEYYRVLKPGRWIVVEFHNSANAVWVAIQNALQKAGFIVASVSLLDKIQTTLHQDHKANAVEKDLAISAYKPGGELVKRIEKSNGRADGIWEFVRSHLQNVPVIKPRAGNLDFVAEREPRVLYDRMLAYFVLHNIPIPLSYAEFRKELEDRFPGREGMFFTAEQVALFDQKRAKCQSVEQLTIFIEDERSAIDWLRQSLRKKPSTMQEIHPQFMQQLSTSWKKFEARPELRMLLEQNFLNYDGKVEVPSQIHSYLSTQNKDLRNLPKDDARLQARAKDRWYVPDPAKAVDVEAVRNKRLLQEFWDLCTEVGISRPSGPSAQQTLPLVAPTTVKKTGRKKLKEVRTEAVRLGFKECFGAKDYATILAITEHLPTNVIEEDEQLQMMHDMAEMRAQG